MFFFLHFFVDFSLFFFTMPNACTKTKVIAFERRLNSLPKTFHTQFGAKIGSTGRHLGTKPGPMGAYLELVSAQSAHVNSNER